jgi:hypothetical protein
MALFQRAAALSGGLVVAAALGCAGHGGSSAGARSAAGSLASASRLGAGGHPPLALVTREGDGRGSLAVAVATDGIAPGRGAMAAVALAALVEARVAARGLPVTATGGWGGWRLRILVDGPAEVKAAVDATRDAMLSPVGASDPALAAVTRKAAALVARPLAAASLAGVASCTGDAYSVAGDTVPTAAEVEGWRLRAHGLGRVGLAIAGDRATADAGARALAATPAWPGAESLRPAPWPATEAPVAVYDASGEIRAGGARIVVTARISPDAS